MVTAPCRLLPGCRPPSPDAARRVAASPCPPRGFSYRCQWRSRPPGPALPRQTFPGRAALCPWPLEVSGSGGCRPPTSLSRTRPPSVGSRSPVILARPAAASPRGGGAGQPLRPAGASARPWRLRVVPQVPEAERGGVVPVPPVSGEGAQLVREAQRPPRGLRRVAFAASDNKASERAPTCLETAVLQVYTRILISLVFLMKVLIPSNTRTLRTRAQGGKASRPPPSPADAQGAPAPGQAGLWGHAPVRRRLVILEGDLGVGASLPAAPPPALTTCVTPQCVCAEHRDV